MTTLTFPELDELEGKLANRLKAAGDFVDEAKQADGVLDLAKIKSVEGSNIEKAEWFQKIQDEISDLTKKAEPLRVIKAMSDPTRSLDDEDRFEKDAGQKRRGVKSIGEQFAARASERDNVKRFSQELDFDLKTTMTTSAGWAPDIIRGPRMVDFATRPLELLDLIPTTTTDQTSVAFMEETTFTNAAAERNEGAAKAESALALTERTSAVRSIATNLPVTDEQLEDVQRIQAYIDNRLPFFLRQRLELQSLVGDGAAPNLRGVNNVVGIQTQAKGADPTPDAVYKAMVLIMTVGQALPDAVVFNPLDWQDVRLLRTADGLYIWGNPSDAGPERIWGLPVILSQAQTQNTAVVGAWKMFSELAVKKGITVERGFINDDFTKDITRLRAEMRAALIFYRPAAFATVTGI